MTFNQRNENWSDLQKECYERNCNCHGCKYSHYSTVCKVKTSIIEKILLFGIDESVETKKWLQE